MIFSTQTMQEILPLLQSHLHTHKDVSFTVLNPDLDEGYAGHEVILDESTYLYRGYKTWCDLAELLKCKMHTPIKIDNRHVKLTFVKLKEDSFHINKNTNEREKYGTTSHFSRIHKMEEPAFYYYYNQALDNVNIENKTHILNLGINRADEFEVIKNKIATTNYENMKFIGIDHSDSAISYAKSIFTKDNFTFYAEDINNIEKLKLTKFDLIISIGTLQSPSINFKPFLMKLVQEYLTKDAAIILGFPNSRWVGGEIIYGAKAPNYKMNEMSLLFNDVVFAKKYLQQKKYRVTITGKYYIFLTATKII
jgi:hypothetical protein